jgi:trans-aconitate methyltransferase
MLMPLTRHFEMVTGVDIAPAMLARAADNCRAAGIANVRLERPPALPGDWPRVDFIHAYEVFQHIPPGEGLRTLDRLLAALLPGGVGMLHFPFRCTSRRRILFSGVMRRVPLLYSFWNLMKGRAFGYPYMQMNVYALDRILAALVAAGCRDCHGVFEQAGDYQWILLYLHKPSEC